MKKQRQEVRQIAFDESAVRMMERLRTSIGASTDGEVLARALAFYSWALDQSIKGHQVGLIKRSFWGDSVLEVRMPWQEDGDW